MTDNEIIKAYEDKVNLIGSMTSVCLDGEDGFDLYEVMLNALDLIKRKDEQIESLIAGQETLQKFIVEKDAEIERLEERIIEVQRCDKELIETLHKVHEEKVKTAKFEAVKEFAERLKTLVDDGYVVDIIDNLVKEMVGDNI